MSLYQFDRELSVLIFSMISKIEVALRVRLVEALLVHGDALILQDSSVFKEKKMYWKNMSTIASEIARSNDVFIKHNFDKHEGEVPVWAAVEVLSFGTLSKIIKNLKTGTGSAYSILATNYQYTSKKGNLVNPSQKMFASWVQGVSVLRNMCAHNSRIYNRTIHTTPEILDVDKITPSPAHNGLYQILLSMKYLRSSNEEWMEFVDKLSSLIHKSDRRQSAACFCMGFSLLKALEFFVFRKMEMPETKTHLLCGWSQIVIQKSPFRYNRVVQALL